MTRRHALLAATTLLTWFAMPAAPPVTLHLIGDSTMADKPDPEHNPERGWGQALPGLVKHGTVVRNYARNGRSTKSFIAEGRWDSVRTALVPGDYVFIQFGHNDEKFADSTRYAAAGTDYRANLERFVRESRAAGAIPILFTPIARRQFRADGTLEPTHGEYPAVVRDLAQLTGVPLVDLETLTSDRLREMGDEKSKRWFVFTREGEFPAFPAARQDNTHLSHEGARRVAELAVDALALTAPALANCCLRASRHASIPGEEQTRPGTVMTEGDMQNQNVSRLEELFVGRFPGVQVYSAPGGISVRIRGSGTVNGGGEPLYLVDGMIMEPGPGGLITINPRDVARIEVLKSAGEIAEYGVRGANGIIRITTRRR